MVNSKILNSSYFVIVHAAMVITEDKRDFLIVVVALLS